MASPYNYAGLHIAQAGAVFDVQHKNMGILELAIDKLVPGAKEPLILALEDFNIPGRKIGTGNLPYLNGNSQYLTRPEPMEKISITFRDFPQVGIRGILHRWFSRAYDEETGLALPSGLLKCDGFVVLFQTDATAERTARLEGLMPTDEPPIEVSYGDGAHMVMKVNLSVDRIIWEPSLFNPVS
jgi:hypothetical protein